MMILLAAAAAMAQVEGVLITNEGRQMPGIIQWSARDKGYKIKAKGGSQVEVVIEEEKIDRLVIPKPKDLTSAEALVKTGDGAQAIPLLKKIIDGYYRLNWDERATRLLADAHIANADPKSAIDVCEKIISADPDKAYLGEMAPSYWKALLMADKVATLDNLVTKAVKSEDRNASAFALIVRGDMIRKTSDTNENAAKALRDGYLRVVTLYKGIKAAQPEALYKAAKCFDKLGQSSRADQMRTTLKGEFGSSEWALK
jgi:tetratricopeptide (TPR) repeat protein